MRRWQCNPPALHSPMIEKTATDQDALQPVRLRLLIMEWLLTHLLQSGRRNFEGIKYSCGFADNIFVRISKCSATFSGLR